MNTMDSGVKPLRLGVAALLAALLAGCGKPPPPPGDETPAPAPPPPQTAAVPVPTQEIPVVTVSAAPAASSSASAPAPTARPAAAGNEPAVATMQLAQPSGKLGVPVDLRYQVDGEALDGQTVTVHLAAVPRVAGTNLAVSVKDVPGIRTSVGGIRAEKVTVATPYRRQLAITRDAGAPAELRVLVTMDLPEGQAFSWFSVPLSRAPAAAGKQAPVRME